MSEGGSKVRGKRRVKRGLDMDKRIEALKNIWADISEEKQNSKFET